MLYCCCIFAQIAREECRTKKYYLFFRCVVSMHQHCTRRKTLDDLTRTISRRTMIPEFPTLLRMLQLRHTFFCLQSSC
ncbi:hypothetical protein NY2A_b152R [Paramecium bursaria Chlorella virus NY2A]|uniref:Uncharacterized protein b152R n=1 Tax=Paramecium bursaria Chlorella virus NY2A TaxID=46021 RepID=A7IW27_PBCVN|nr:hypothetical protein NY2A_b152R [Paramecium bursaria Chlorella virus NY2A]ABT14551.1 hypothetical protein NY2A_b152R [Paramecium bursaria Chlorella virus NY2A]